MVVIFHWENKTSSRSTERHRCKAMPFLHFFEGESMNKASSFGFYPLPREAILKDLMTQIAEGKQVRRRDKKSKLFLYLPLIRHCLDQKMSLRAICEILFKAEDVKVHASTLCRFVQKYPLLKVAASRSCASTKESVAQHGL